MRDRKHKGRQDIKTERRKKIKRECDRERERGDRIGVMNQNL